MLNSIESKIDDKNENKTETKTENINNTQITKTLPNGINNTQITKTLPNGINNTQMTKDLPKTSTVQHNINISNISNLNSVAIKFDDTEYSFGIYNLNKTFLGKFSSKQLIKFVCKQICPSFMSDVEVESAVPLIQKYICDVVFSNDYKITLLNHLQSPFMGNIELLIKLYQGITKCNEIIKNELLKIYEIKEKHKVIKILKQLSYLLLNYCIRLIAQISDVIKNDETKKELKESLTKYSIMIVYKLNTMMRDEIDEKTNTYKLLQDDIIRMGKFKLEMYKKIDEIGKKINEQSKNISELNSKITNLPNSTNTHEIKLSSTSDAITFDSDTINSTVNTTGNSSYMFNDSDCYFTDSGNDFDIDYLSTQEKNKVL